MTLVTLLVDGQLGIFGRCLSLRTKVIRTVARDDLDKLPIPSAVRRYARRHGLRGTTRTYDAWAGAQLAITGQRPGPFKSRDVGVVESGEPLWKVDNVYVAGRRRSGETRAEDAQAALRRFIARNARELGVDVASAITRAREVGGHKVTLVDEVTYAPEYPITSEFTEWPARTFKTGVARLVQP